VLEEGMKFETYSIPNEDAQFLETRKFQRAEIAGMYGVPPHMIGDTERSTSWGTGIEEQVLGFMKFTIQPYLAKWEQEINRKLFDVGGRYFAEFVVDGLLRADIGKRYTAYSIGRQWGWLSADDIRELENMNPLSDGDGDIYLQPMNMIEAGEEPPPAPPPAGATPQETESEDEGEASGDTQVNSLMRYAPILEDALKRCERREAKAWASVEDKARSEGQKAVDKWCQVFFREHAVYVRNAILPIVQAMAFDIAEDAGVTFLPSTDVVENWTSRHISARSNARKRGGVAQHDYTAQLLVIADMLRGRSSAAA
jgi:hypothetical protein